MKHRSNCLSDLILDRIHSLFQNAVDMLLSMWLWLLCKNALVCFTASQKLNIQCNHFMHILFYWCSIHPGYFKAHMPKVILASSQLSAHILISGDTKCHTPRAPPLLTARLVPASASRQPRHWSVTSPAWPVIGHSASEHRRLEPFSAGLIVRQVTSSAAGPGPRMRGQESSSGGQLAVWDHTLPGPLNTAATHTRPTHWDEWTLQRN